MKYKLFGVGGQMRGNGRRNLHVGALTNFSQVFAKRVDDFLPAAIVDILTEFLKRDMHDVVVMKFFRRDFVAEFQPNTVEQIDFLICQPRSMRTQIKYMFLSRGRVDLERQLRSRFRERFPCQPRYASLARDRAPG